MPRSSTRASIAAIVAGFLGVAACAGAPEPRRPDTARVAADEARPEGATTDRDGAARDATTGAETAGGAR
ncbi:MAG TPA: hypothetical protein RMH99_20785, partial [Sandaracinaceae bacterium LLY-WYZ-13_1]|nr:hypothetical protein [Sandaracinaceae bacterium LLY-WYZ-13_1]